MRVAAMSKPAVPSRTRDAKQNYKCRSRCGALSGHADGEGEAGQGQLQLKPCAHYYFQEELFVPTATASLHDEAVAAGMLLEQR